MRDEPYIDAEFEVIEDRPPVVVRPPDGKWTFWGDDFPELVGIATGFAAAIVLAAVFHH